MASGFCVRVLLLSLIAFGPHANALTYRMRGSTGNKPYFEVAEDFPSGHKPGLASSGYESSVQPGGSLGSSGPSYPDSSSSEKVKPAGAGDYIGSYGRQVGGYSRERSVSTYMPDPRSPSKPRQNPQQPHYQTEMHSQRQSASYPAKPQQPSYPAKPQQPSYPAKPQQPSYPAKPQQPSYPAKPQQPSYPAKPQQPSVTQSKAGMWDIALPQNRNTIESGVPSGYGIVTRSDRQSPSYPAKPQQPSYPAKPQQPSYPAKPQQPSVTQSKAGMWDIALPQNRNTFESGVPSGYGIVTRSDRQSASYPAKPQQPSYPAKPQQPSYPAKPQQPSVPAKPQQPSVTQSKAGMWDIALPQNRNTIESGVPSGYGIVTRSDRQSASYPAKPQQPSVPAKPQQPSVTQSKAGMWDIALPQNGDTFESDITSSYGITMHSDGQSADYPAKPQQPSYPAKPQQPSYSAKPPGYPAKPQQPSHLAKPQQPTVTQSKAGMWDIALSQEGVAMDSNEQPTESQMTVEPRGSRPYRRRYRHWCQAWASVIDMLPVPELFWELCPGLQNP
ncbi:adhesive plaque matrix protein-like isoform X2 [Xiphias gladius]|uniref:adhesive plaque matrix protein-like isoform X2 n=1 Tax=Xiphias gladius TaxID=8245 RepID=UPI001A9A1603|nr:adhesive plaque matrix protein-like isoform X2 [Xiphias gladius]